MKDERFITVVRFKTGKALPYAAYITDNATGMKFTNSFDTKEQAEKWIEWAEGLMTKGRPN